MPIILFKNIAYVVSRSEFINEYRKLDKEETTVLKKLMKKFDFEKSVLAITEIYNRGIEKHKSDEISKLFSFDYQMEEAQSIALELIIFFSEFYHKFSILDSEKNKQLINEYILPHKKKYFIEKSHIIINEGQIYYTLYINQISRIRGLINNFVIYLDNYLLHFCSDVGSEQFINIEPFMKNSINDNGYHLNDFDYIFERNKPSRYRLLKYRQKGFIVVIQ